MVREKGEEWRESRCRRKKKVGHVILPTTRSEEEE
jgi:hypothetical protein